MTTPSPSRLSVIALLAVLAAAPLAARAAPAGTAPARTTPIGSSDPALGAPVGAADYSALLGLEFPPSGFNVGPRLSGEYMYSFMDLSPQARLKLGGRAAFAYHGSDVTDVSLWLLEAVPDAKLVYAIAPMLAVYGDVGLGLALIHVSTPEVVTPVGTFGGSDNSLALTFQFGGGVSYAVSPNMNLLGEIRFDIYTKSGTGTFISVPTVGVQFH